MKKYLVILLLLLFGTTFALPAEIALAQQGGGDFPVYVVQEGDSIWGIAQRFGITVDELTGANGIVDANQLTVGMQLKIPGLEGLQGELITQKVPYGMTLPSLSRKYQMSIDLLARLNRMVNPEDLYAGANLVLVEQTAPASETDSKIGQAASFLKPGETLLEYAAAHGQNPWQIAFLNQMDTTWKAIPTDVLLPSLKAPENYSQIPYPITKVEVFRLPLGQGKTATVRLTVEDTATDQISLTGTLAGKTLNFFPLPFTDATGQVTATEYIALQGIENTIEPGFYPLTLDVTWKNGAHYAFSQPVYVADSKYEFDPPLKVVDEALLDPTLTQPEEDQLKSLNSIFSQEKYWTGVFHSPVDPQFTDCWPSTFGRRRSYNGSNYTYIHSGLDFCGQVGNKVYAPAKGKVVFTGELFVRGNATVIDHGWGIFTVYAHQDKIEVKVGDLVEAGQEIGLIGQTGRVTGPHLHWELWAGGVRVDPYDWLLNEYPQSEVSIEASSGG